MNGKKLVNDNISAFMKKLTHQNVIAGSFAILAVIFFIVFFKYYSAERVSLISSRWESFSQNWYYYKQGERIYFDLPVLKKGSIPTDEKDVSRIYHDFEDNCPPDFHIGFFSERQYTKVLIDNTVIDTFQGKNYPKWFPVIGLVFHIVQIPNPESLNGKSLCIELQSVYSDNKGIYMDVVCGTRTALRQYLFERSNLKIIGSILILCVGLLLLMFAWLYRKNLENDHTMRALGFLSVQVSLWLLSDCCFIQLITANPIFNWLVNYLFFLFLPLTFLYFIEELTVNHNSRAVGIMTYVYVFFDFGFLFLEILGCKLYVYSMSFTIIAMFFVIVYLIYTIIKGLKKKNRTVKKWGAPMIVLISGAVAEMIHYLFFTYETSGVIVFAFLIFFILLGINVYRSSITKISRMAESETYRKLAFIDFQTNVFNRTAYFNFVENYNEDPKKYCIILFDLNNLKKINDNYGHLYGDKVIKAFSDCAMDAFGKIGNIYRIGGDEFLALIKEPVMIRVQDACHRFENSVLAQKKIQFQFTVAYGYTEFTAAKPEDFYLAQKTADTKMYAMKADMKENNSFVYQNVSDNHAG